MPGAKSFAPSLLLLVFSLCQVILLLSIVIIALWLVHCFPVNLFLKFIMYSYRFSPNMQIYLLRFCAAESMIPIFRPFSSTGQLSKSCTILVSFLLSIKSMQIWSVNLVLPWCNRLPLISSIFCFFKFAEWADVCRTRMSSRKRIRRTSLGLRLVLIQFFRGHTDIFQSP